MIDWKTRAQALTEQLTASGHLRTPEWHAVFAAVARHEFVPVFFDQHAPGQWRQVNGVDRTMRDEWLSAVYSNTTLVTALEDIALPPGTDGNFAVAVSSSTEPGLMAQMLEDLDIHPGQTVLEIGTGTGYNAALLCERLGEDHVFSVDLRRDQIETAKCRLARAGYHPTLTATNGAEGLPDHGPYDRIIATCSVQCVPPAWIEQLKPGGILLADIEGTIYTGNLATLHWHNDATVQGRFSARYGSFMPMQHQLGIEPGRSHPTDPASGSERTTALSPDFLHQRQRPLAFYTQLHLPAGAQLQLTETGDGTRLIAPDGSWCEITHQPDAHGRHHLIQGGPTCLWDIIEHAHEQYTVLGCPDWERFGITATTIQQRIWLDSPDHDAQWPLAITTRP